MPTARAAHQPADRDERRPPVRRVVAPLVVGSADDRAEVEADRVAAQVIARLQGGESAEGHVHDGCHGAASVARSTAPSTTGAEVGREGGAISDGLSERIERGRSGGTALPDPVRRRMEAGFGTSLADVRIHTGSESASLNSAISARAFTAGKDIFFGAGEYRPDTAAGEQVLAHEIAHTRQHGGGARRVHRKWDIKAKKLDLASTTSVETVPSGQLVFFFNDASGDKIVIKNEDREVGLAELSSFMHVNLSGAKSVNHRKLTESDKQDAIAAIKDPARKDKASFARAAQHEDNGWAWGELETQQGLPKGSGRGQIEPDQVGHHAKNTFLDAEKGKTMVAMTFAAGQTAAQTGKTAQTNAMDGSSQSRLRNLVSDARHMEALGKLTAVDLFLGNQDRVMSGNLGNWIYDPDSSSMTAIDHVDANVSGVFRNGDTVVNELAQRNLAATAQDAVAQIARGASIFSGDGDFAKWLDATPYRRAAMEEQIYFGLVEGRKLLIKTFTASRFSGSSKSRSLKKAIKKTARGAVATDKGTAGDKDEYYKLLKTRAEWLKKN